MNVVTRAEFARMQGWNRSHVSRLAQAGRLVLSTEGHVLVAESLKRIEDTKDPNRDDVAARHAERRQAAITPLDAQDAEESAGDDSGAPGAGPSYAESRAIKESYAAKTAQLDFERAAGKLCEVADVERAHRDLGTMLRQALERLPDQLAPELAPETDAGRVHALLQGAIEDALRSISDRAHSMVKRLQGV